MRRRLAAIATIATLVVLLAAPAAFAASAKVTQPSDTVRGPTDVRVEITRDSRVEPISRARVRLQRGGDTLGDWVDLACKQRCADDQLRQTWGPADDRELDPATGAPFTSGGALRNGEYELQVRVERGRFLDPLESTDRVRLSVPPSAPGDVTAKRDGDEVEVRWKKAPEPDVAGYRVERRDGDGWREVHTTSTDSHVDEPGPGSHTYRVVALRDDGRGGTLEKASSEREVEIPEPEDEDPDERSGHGDGNGNGDGGSEGSGDVDGEDERSGSGDGAGNGDDAEEATEAEDRAGSSGERDRRTSSSARAPSLGSDGSGSIPSVFGRSPETADPDAYSEELDFGEARNGDGEDPDDDVVLSGGRSGTIDRLLDAERIATPIAVGLVLTATGMHLWRWLRVPGL